MSDLSETTATQQARRSNSRSRIAQWSSLAALGVSAMALALGVYQTRLMQTQARASVWPYVIIGYHYSDRAGDPDFELHIENNGVGPALLRSVRVTLDGKPMDHWEQVWQLIDLKRPTNSSMASLQGVVIPPSTNRETQVNVLKIRDAAAAEKMFDARDRLKIDICYCSVYNDCWNAHWMQPRQEDTPSCHASDHEFDY